MFNSKVFLAEFIGTFALVFVGMSAGIIAGPNGGMAGLVGIALAHGFTVAAFVYAYGHISGSHLNPAVTWALLWTGTIKWGQAIFYLIGQFAGAILAAYFLKVVMATVVEGGVINGGLTIGALTEKAPVLAMVMEAILTFFLVNTILHTAVSGKGGRFAGWAIGTTLVFAILAGGPFTGASLNPARTFGPAIILFQSINVYTFVIYLFGPLIGSTLAVLAYNFFNSADEALEEDDMSVVVEIPAKGRKPAARKMTK